MSVTWESEAMKRERELGTAFEAGVKAGRLDRFIGIRSEYAYHVAGDGGYAGAYGTGYRDGIDGMGSKNPWRVR